MKWEGRSRLGDMSGGQQRFRNKSTFRMKMQSQKQRNKNNNNNGTDNKNKLVKIMKENLKKSKFKAKCKISIFKHVLEDHLTWPHLNLGDMNGWESLAQAEP